MYMIAALKKEKNGEVYEMISEVYDDLFTGPRGKPIFENPWPVFD